MEAKDMVLEVLDLRLAPVDAKSSGKGPVAYARVRVGCVECSDLPVWKDSKLGFRIGAKRESWKNKSTGKEEHRDIVRFSLSSQVAIARELVTLMVGARPATGAPIGGPVENVEPGATDIPF